MTRHMEKCGNLARNVRCFSKYLAISDRDKTDSEFAVRSPTLLGQKSTPALPFLGLNSTDSSCKPSAAVSDSSTVSRNFRSCYYLRLAAAFNHCNHTQARGTMKFAEQI
jgi:hypothetical protein